MKGQQNHNRHVDACSCHIPALFRRTRIVSNDQVSLGSTTAILLSLNQVRFWKLTGTVVLKRVRGACSLLLIIPLCGESCSSCSQRVTCDVSAGLFFSRGAHLAAH
jgi:hypothetical protein